MIEFDKIYLVWRKGSGGRRTAVGEVSKLTDGTYSFKYLPRAVESLKGDGFMLYTEFQDVNKVYNGNVVEIFGQRLTKFDRPDIKSFYDFWEVDNSLIHDKFYLLGKTQGLVPTDSFEFLADYKLTPNLHFLTEISGLSKVNLVSGTLQIGDTLRFEKESENTYDKFAIKIFKHNLELGYIKKFHSKVFYESGAEDLTLTVKAIEQNGIIKRVFVKVGFE